MIEVVNDINGNEALSALDKGSNKASGFIASRNDLVDLFNRVVFAAEHCLENFDKKKFIERSNNKKAKEFLKKMLLGAFESVQCLYVMQVEINKIASSDLLEGRADSLQLALLQAVSVYQTNGLYDPASLCTQRLIQSYRSGKSKDLLDSVIPFRQDCA